MTIEEKLGPLGLAEYLPLFSQEKITLELLELLERRGDGMRRSVEAITPLAN